MLHLADVQSLLVVQKTFQHPFSKHQLALGVDMNSAAFGTWGDLMLSWRRTSLGSFEGDEFWPVSLMPHLGLAIVCLL